jgi:spore coat protein U-like protein
MWGPAAPKTEATKEFQMMKQQLSKLALALGAVVMTGNVMAASGTADVTATVVTPLTVTKVNDLAFGKFSAGAGTVVISAETGARTQTGTVTLQGGTTGRATFSLSGQDGLAYTATLEAATITLSGSGDTPPTMLAVLSMHNDTGTFDEVAITLGVGGTLNVAENQAADTYDGTLSVTVNYD